MNLKKTAATLVLGLVAVFLMTGCPSEVPADPAAPAGPGSTWTGAPTAFKVVSTVSKGAIRYAMDWGDMTVDTTDVSYASGETATVTHEWAAVGTVSVKVMALNDAKPEKASAWSPAASVSVALNQAPVITEVVAPPVAVKDVPAYFTVKAYDPDGDSIKVKVKWGDGNDTLTGLFATPCSVEVSNAYSKVETLNMIAWAVDQKGTQSIPDTTRVIVGTAGGVIWHWWNDDENTDPGITSAIVFTDGDNEVVSTGCDDGKYYAIKVVNGKATSTGSTKFLDYTFTGHGGFCAATQHVIVGSDEGLLYGLKLTMGREWVWPEVSNETLLTFNEWGAPAINNNKIYIGSMNDSMYYFQDLGSQGNRIAAYGVHASILDAPAIDVQGNVLFSTDSGQMYKMDPNLGSPLWRAQLQGNGEVHGPVIGADGTIYCTSDSFHVYALDPATGMPKWTITLDGEAIRPALSATDIIVGTSYGKVYSISQATGAITWQKQLDPDAFETTPIVTTGGYVYIQNTNDVLYCINQADGVVIWSCDCKRFLPRTGHPNRGRARQLQLVDYLPEPSIAANGNILVVGSDAVYCVAGYPERPLDPTAPWPKWQKTLHNTGK